nr:hypothetical protein [Pedobacter borealis]
MHFTISLYMTSPAASLLKLFLPDFILANFTITGVIEDPDTFHIHLEEINNLQSELEFIKVYSKGFFPEITVQDFPIRGQSFLSYQASPMDQYQKQ